MRSIIGLLGRGDKVFTLNKSEKRQKHTEYMRIWLSNPINAQKRKEASDRFKQNHPTYHRVWREKNPDKVKQHTLNRKIKHGSEVRKAEDIRYKTKHRTMKYHGGKKNSQVKSAQS
jgi:hypothetical protein